MRINLAYGSGEINFSLPDRNVCGILEPSPLPPTLNVEKSVRLSLERPTEGPPLKDLLRDYKPRNVVIIVNDLTRSTPTSTILPPVLDVLHQGGIPKESVKIIIANGTHRQMSEIEMLQIVGKEIQTNYSVLNHDCDSSELVSMGTLSTGNQLWVNKFVALADFRIAVGEILFHYYAGFAGGRKSLLPGVTGRKTTMANHALMLHPQASIGNLTGNPVHEEMHEALDFCPLHFIVNVISDSHKRVVRIVSGDPVKAWLEGVATFSKMNTIEVPYHGDVVFVSAGGFPKDINLYQAHKAMEMAANILTDNGTLIVAAECREGLGHQIFAEWVHECLSPEAIEERLKKQFSFGGHKLYYLSKLAKKVKILLFSKLDEETTRKVFCRKLSSFEHGLDFVASRYGKKFRAFVIPQGGIILPKVKPI